MQVLKEQRLASRLGMIIPLRIHFEDRDSVTGQTVNVSSRGLSCRIPCYVSPFSRLTVNMDMLFRGHGQVALQLDALVVRAEKCHGDFRHDEHDLGLFFLNLNQEKVAILSEFLNESVDFDKHEPVSVTKQQNIGVQGGCLQSEVNPQGCLPNYQLTRLNRLACLGELSSVLAHEIKNPLAGLAGSLQILGEEIRGIYPSEDLFSELFCQIERIDNIVDHLLQFSATETPRKKKISVEDVINGTLSLIGGKLREKNIQVTLCHGYEQPLVSADERLLRQSFLSIFANLVDNIEPNGRITVNTCWADKAPVCDRGSCGCSVPKESKGLNVVVMTSGSVEKRSGDGMLLPSLAQRKKQGLDMSLAQQIIEQHNGSIFVQSPQDESSVLLVALPL